MCVTYLEEKVNVHLLQIGPSDLSSVDVHFGFEHHGLRAHIRGFDIVQGANHSILLQIAIDSFDLIGMDRSLHEERYNLDVRR